MNECVEWWVEALVDEWKYTVYEPTEKNIDPISQSVSQEVPLMDCNCRLSVNL
jgi:hypothetical protein